jgi:hypothetical protein
LGEDEVAGGAQGGGDGAQQDGVLLSGVDPDAEPVGV